MTGAEQLQEIARSLRDGKDIPRVTVREFLSWFGAQRRGSFVAQTIRFHLARAGLTTEPDFESTYIDAPIKFALKTESSQSATEEAATPIAPASSSASVTAITDSDPTYRISKLAAANKAPLSVPPDATIQQAVTMMLINDFSQLPVMTNERDVKGIVSWTSIGTRLVLGRDGTFVRQVMDGYQEIRSDSSLFQAIPIIVQHQYVLVRGGDNRITGIVTASDLSLQFQQLAEPFLLLSEIENHIRRILADKFSEDDLASIRDPDDREREISNVADLTFGEYVRLLENDGRWKKINVSIDRTTFCKQLDQVRSIRNDVMHFDPDGIPPEDLERLRDFARFLQRLHAIGAS